MEETAINVHRRGFNVHDTTMFYQSANIEQYAKLDIHTAVTDYQCLWGCDAV